MGQPEPPGDDAQRGTRSVRVVPLDILRAVAIALVFGSHLPTPATALPARLDTFFLFWKRFGWTGVDQFFVLSGFLVSGLLFREYATTGAIRPGRFRSSASAPWASFRRSSYPLTIRSFTRLATRFSILATALS